MNVDKVKVPATKKMSDLPKSKGSKKASKILELREKAELALKEKEKAKEKRSKAKMSNVDLFEM